jgi:hypothetical protein
MATVTIYYGSDRGASLAIWPGFLFTRVTVTTPFEYVSNNLLTTVGNGDQPQFPGDIVGVVIPTGATAVAAAAFAGCNNASFTSLSIADSVTSIGIDAFQSCRFITSIGLSGTSGVTSIGNGAYYLCQALPASLVLPNSLVTIGSNAFVECEFNTVTIGPNVTSIGDTAFSTTNLTTIIVDVGNTSYTVVGNVLFTTGQTTLTCYPRKKPGTSYTIPDATTVVAGSAFSKNLFLTTVTCGSGIVTIGSSAFGDCTNLSTFSYGTSNPTSLDWSSFLFCPFTTFSIPDSVTTVTNNCTNPLVTVTIGSGCPNNSNDWVPNSATLLNYIVNPGSANYSTESDILYNLDKSTLIYIPQGQTITSFTIPSTVQTIGTNAIQVLANLTSLTIPSTVQTLSDVAITNLPGITSLNIPASVTSIGSGAISSMPALTTLNFANGLNFTPTGSGAFSNNSNLTSVTMYNSVTTLDAYSFEGCTKLRTDDGAPYQGTLYTDALPGSVVYDFFLPAGTNGYYVNYEPFAPDPICFKEGSKILTDKGYIAVQDLRNGDLVKTVSSGFKKIEHIGFSKMYNNANDTRSKDKLYRCSTSEYPELTEDLIVTGCHSILVKNFKDYEQVNKTQEVLGKIYITDTYYRLPACVDERTKIFEEEGVHTIWHFSLEHSDYYMNYGVYANGLLVETTSNRMMVELSGMTLV